MKGRELRLGFGRGEAEPEMGEGPFAAQVLVAVRPARGVLANHTSPRTDAVDTRASATSGPRWAQRTGAHAMPTSARLEAAHGHPLLPVHQERMDQRTI